MKTATNSVPLSLVFNSKGAKTLISRQPDDTRPALAKGQRPSKRAIRLANALMVEQMLHEGAFPSVEAAMRALGITRSMRTCLFRTLDMSPQEMERVLNERY